MFRTYVVFEVDGGFDFILYYKNNEVKALYQALSQTNSRYHLAAIFYLEINI